VSAVVSDKAIMDKWAPGAHGGTYGGNAVGTAAAYATLQVVKDEGLVENAASMGAVLKAGLEEIQARNPVIGDVRGLGLMVATEFIKPDGAPNPEAVAAVIQRCQDEKVLLLNCGTWDQVIRVIPPLVVNESQINDFLDVYERAVSSI
jgi:4-aminobutyrate aminotransferase